MTKPWRVDVDDNSIITIKAEWRSPRLGAPVVPCICRYIDGALSRIIAMSPEMMEQLGNDCLRVARNNPHD